MTNRFICIHGHFYQPPRENPWLEFLEIQDSAVPMHDWNERVFQECYAPNSAARINDQDGNIIKIVNNYEWISFNFGPTLLSWIEGYNPEVYDRIIQADHLSRTHFGGHGNAIAQVFNHVIMPLATDEDKLLQVQWGIQDFEMRFGRKPEGMWLAETAVDLKTLEVLESQGIRFTILSPYQAHRFRKAPSRHSVNPEWIDCSKGQIDPKRPYRVKLPNGKSISVFFYDAHLSKAVAFEKILTDATHFISSMKRCFNPASHEAQLVHIATDGESYGHHHKFADMTLGYTVDRLNYNDEVSLINYGLFLEKFPPTYEAEIYDFSSWSCSHGVERWRSDCGCSCNGEPGWTQQWRGPLREALQFLGEKASALFHSKMPQLCRNPQKAMMHYFDVIYHSQKGIDRQKFVYHHQKKALSDDQIVQFYHLLEIRRNANLMFTSCGWFFSEISGIETVQILAYAGRVIQLMWLFGVDYEGEFLKILSNAKSNKPELSDGQYIFQHFVRPQFIDLKRIGVHFAITSLVNHYSEFNPIYAFTVQCLDMMQETDGHHQIGMGHIRVSSDFTTEAAQFQFAVIRFNDTDFQVSISPFESDQDYLAKKQLIFDQFFSGSMANVIQALTDAFGAERYRLDHILTDEKRDVIHQVLQSEIQVVNQAILDMVQTHQHTIEYCYQQMIPLPKSLMIFNEHTIQKIIEHLFSGEFQARDIFLQISQIMRISEMLSIEFDLDYHVQLIQTYLEAQSELYFSCPESDYLLYEFIVLIHAVRLLPWPIQYWNLENRWFYFLSTKASQVLDQYSNKHDILVSYFRDIQALLKIGNLFR